MLMTHYREPIDFSVRKLEEAESILDKWYAFLGDGVTAASSERPTITPQLNPGLLDALNDDLRTPEAIQALHRMIGTNANLTQVGKIENRRSFLLSANSMGLLSVSATEWFMARNNMSSVPPEDAIQR